MRITERQRENLETALDAAHTIVEPITSAETGDTLNFPLPEFARVLALIERAQKIVREVPAGTRKVRSDMGAPRPEASTLEGRVGGAVVP